MSLSTSDIILALTRGTDPFTGAPFPKDHICNNVQVIRALADALHKIDSVDNGSVHQKENRQFVPRQVKPRFAPEQKYRGKPSKAPVRSSEDVRYSEDVRNVGGRSEDVRNVGGRSDDVRNVGERSEDVRNVGGRSEDAKSKPAKVKAVVSSEPKPSNDRKVWNDELDAQVKTAYQTGLSIEDIAKQQERTPVAIRVRLTKLGLIEGELPPSYTRKMPGDKKAKKERQESPKDKPEKENRKKKPLPVEEEEVPEATEKKEKSCRVVHLSETSEDSE